MFLLISACKTSKLPKEKTVADTKIEDFLTVAGISKGDLANEALAKLGTPTSNTTRRSRGRCNYDDAMGERLLSYSYKKKTNQVNHIRLTGNHQKNYESTKAFLNKAGINDLKVNFLNMHKDEIIKILGAPLDSTKKSLVYKKEPIKIIFSLSPFGDDKCSEIYVFWNYYYKEHSQN